MSKYRVFSGPYFLVIGPEKISFLDTFHGVIVVSHFQIGTVSESHYLKSANFAPGPSSPFFQVLTEVVTLSSFLTSSLCELPFLFPTSFI